MNTEFLDDHDRTLNHTGPVIGTFLQQCITCNHTCQLCHIEFTLTDGLRKPFFGKLYLRHLVNIRTPANMHGMHLLCNGIHRFPVGCSGQFQH